MLRWRECLVTLDQSWAWAVLGRHWQCPCKGDKNMCDFFFALHTNFKSFSPLYSFITYIGVQYIFLNWIAPISIPVVKSREIMCPLENLPSFSGLRSAVKVGTTPSGSFQKRPKENFARRHKRRLMYGKMHFVIK